MLQRETENKGWLTQEFDDAVKRFLSERPVLKSVY
jgi:hypothetical protein